MSLSSEGFVLQKNFQWLQLFEGFKGKTLDLTFNNAWQTNLVFYSLWSFIALQFISDQAYIVISW